MCRKIIILPYFIHSAIPGNKAGLYFMQTNAIAIYVAALQQRFKSGNAIEHTYRGDLQQRSV